MNRRNDFVLYAVSAMLLVGAASIWWQGIRPSPAGRVPTPVNAAPASAKGAATVDLPGTAGTTGGDPSASGDRGAAQVTLFVHVAGAVKLPGVYRLKDGQRLYEAVALAEPEDDADLDALNLAAVLRDSQKVYVPRKGEAATPLYTDMGDTRPPSPVGMGGGATRTVFPLDINTASGGELEELPGIGPVLAAAIIARRTEFGPYERTEDLKNVPGIGEKTYAKIAPFVTVR